MGYTNEMMKLNRTVRSPLLRLSYYVAIVAFCAGSIVATVTGQRGYVLVSLWMGMCAIGIKEMASEDSVKLPSVGMLMSLMYPAVLFSWPSWTTYVIVSTVVFMCALFYLGEYLKRRSETIHDATR